MSDIEFEDLLITLERAPEQLYLPTLAPDDPPFPNLESVVMHFTYEKLCDTHPEIDNG